MSSFLFAALFGGLVLRMTLGGKLPPQTRRSPFARAPLQETTHRLGLHYEERSALESDRVTGQLQGFEISIDCPAERSLKGLWRAPRSTRIRLKAPELPRYFSVHPARTQDEGLSTADPRFDARFVVRGRRLDAVARLSAQVRAQLRKASPYVSIQDQVIQLKHPGVLSTAGMITSLEILLRLAEHLCFDRSQLPDRLLLSALQDPQDRVRWLSAELLLHQYPLSAQAREMLTIAASSTVPQLHFLAAIRAGAKGRDFLVRAVGDPQLEPQLRVRALIHLARSAPVELVGPLLIESLSSSEAPQRRAAAVHLGRLRYQLALQPLIDALQDPDQEVQQMVVRALRRLSNPGAMPALVGLRASLNPAGLLADETRAAIQYIERQHRLKADEGRLSLLTFDEPQGALSSSEQGTLGAPSSSSQRKQLPDL